EALKDYDYKWAKLGLSTEDEILVMRLKLDGSPAGPLPFVFREELGGFARVEAAAPGSNFQGISLDVNFRLPLDRILSYGKGLSDVMKMMQDVSD
ncbi:MAG: carboxylate transporter, partial [Desulfobulbaceae bacterium]|nr:carboxylate transporter [Desulfobulbaceae bacterium]